MVGDRFADAVNELLYGVFSLTRFDIAIEIFAGNDLCCQLAPGYRQLDIVLLKDCLATIIGDHSFPYLPLDLVEGMHPWR